MKALKILITLFTLAAAPTVCAQINVKDKIKEESASRAETRMDEGIDKGIDKIEEGVGKLFKKKKANPEKDENFQGAVELCLYEELEPKEMNDDLYPGKRGLQIFMDEESWSSKGYIDDPNSDWLEARSTTNPCEVNKVNHVIIWAQNRRIRIYHQGAKVLDSPTNIYAGSKFNKIRFGSWNSECKPYVSNLKVTTAAPDTRSKLITEGKLVSYGIYFDVNKDVVKAESYGTLNDIAKTLKENPTGRIKILGHTDADGADAANLDLSKRRGASVKNELVKTFGIDASRIEPDGLGETKLIAPNDTPANKALNRRVEFINI